MTALIERHRKTSYDPYSGPGCPLAAGGPSPLNLLYATTDTVKAAYALHQARQVGDAEGKRDASVRVFAAPATFFQAASSVLILFAEHIAAWGGQLLPLIAIIALPMLVLGIGICALELLYEGVHVKRSLTLLNNMHVSEIERLTHILKIEDENKRAKAASDWIRENGLDPKKWNEELTLLNKARREGAPLNEVEPILADIRDKLVSDDLQYLYAKYLTLHEQEQGEMLAVKRAKLARRVMPWCADQVQSSVPAYITLMNTTHGAARAQVSIDATKLLSNVTIQAKKKLIIHSFGIIGIILTIVGLATANPLLLLIAGILITLDYMYAQGTLEEKGWSFSIKKALLPNCVIRWWENRKGMAAPPLDPARVAVI